MLFNIPTGRYLRRKENVMSIVHTVPVEKASGKVSEIYGQVSEFFGRVPNGMQIYSSSPGLLEQQWQSMSYYMQHPTLSFPLLAMIRMVVSERNNCEYCVGMNESLLVNVAGLDAGQVSATKKKPELAPLEQKDKQMLLFVLKAMETPREIAAKDMDELRSLGWSDGEIVDAVAHGARNVAVDIVFNTFKVENDFQ